MGQEKFRMHNVTGHEIVTGTIFVPGLVSRLRSGRSLGPRPEPEWEEQKKHKSCIVNHSLNLKLQISRHVAVPGLGPVQGPKTTGPRPTIGTRNDQERDSDWSGSWSWDILWQDDIENLKIWWQSFQFMPWNDQGLTLAGTHTEQIIILIEFKKIKVLKRLGVKFRCKRFIFLLSSPLIFEGRSLWWKEWRFSLNCKMILSFSF